jgi:23S rRNA (cytidine1920-2'-O)/16S rRNA (cytidine1409-2'-O)-methyltransferase
MTSRAKSRLDRLLVDRGLVETREKAQALIMAGSVLVDGSKLDKPGHAVDAGCRIELLEGVRYASRGGLKLEAALNQFKIDVAGKVCLDVGASTGGFTDCLLQRGAARVHSIDVGKGQLDWKLRNDPRVVVREGINARYLTRDDIGESVSLAVCDVSFISVTLILEAMTAALDAAGEMVILVKPQFEVGRGQVGKGGIVRDPALHQASCRKVLDAVRALGFETDIMESPILGTEGNKEFLLYAHH